MPIFGLGSKRLCHFHNRKLQNFKKHLKSYSALLPLSYNVSLYVHYLFFSFLSSIYCCLYQASLQVIPEDECQLWWAAKELQRGKKLQDYTGKNEKTKLVVKIQKVRDKPPNVSKF